MGDKKSEEGGESEATISKIIPEYYVWKKMGSFTLTQFDKIILESEKEWITDTIINAVQFLLSKDYPYIGGLQNVLLSQIGGFQPVQGKFVQILNENQNHWFTVSNMYRSEVNQVSIYDSKAEDRKDYTGETLKPVFAMLPEATEIRFFLEQVTQQTDNSQCGLLAIAYAKALCSGRNPSEIQFSDDPRALRDHLIKCFTINKIRSFPLGSKTPIDEFVIKRSALPQ